MCMKLYLIRALTFIAMSSLFFSCTTTQNQVSIEVSCDDFRENHHIIDEVQVAKGGTITITLCSNPSTGLQWEPTACCPWLSLILTEVDHRFIPSEGTGNIPPKLGAPGKEIWVYKAYNEGTVTISLDYRYPGESDERGEWTYKIIANVK